MSLRDEYLAASTVKGVLSNGVPFEVKSLGINDLVEMTGSIPKIMVDDPSASMVAIDPERIEWMRQLVSRATISPKILAVAPVGRELQDDELLFDELLMGDVLTLTNAANRATGLSGPDAENIRRNLPGEPEQTA